MPAQVEIIDMLSDMAGIKTIDPRVIPANWSGHTRHDVDASTKRRAVMDGFAHWYEWEKSTKKLYENACKELFELGEVAAAMRVGKLA